MKDKSHLFFDLLNVMVGFNEQVFNGFLDLLVPSNSIIVLQANSFQYDKKNDKKNFRFKQKQNNGNTFKNNGNTFKNNGNTFKNNGITKDINDNNNSKDFLGFIQDFSGFNQIQMNQAKYMSSKEAASVSADDQEIIFRRLEKHNDLLNFYFTEAPIPTAYMD